MMLSGQGIGMREPSCILLGTVPDSSGWQTVDMAITIFRSNHAVAET